VHARLLSACAGDPPHLAPTHRALPGVLVAAWLGGAARAPAGARGRPRLLRRPAPPRRPQPRVAAARSNPDHEGLLAPAPSRLRALARSRTGGRGLAGPRRRRVPAFARRAGSFPRHRPELGPGGADAVGDARA